MIIEINTEFYQEFRLVDLNFLFFYLYNSTFVFFHHKNVHSQNSNLPSKSIPIIHRVYYHWSIHNCLNRVWSRGFLCKLVCGGGLRLSFLVVAKRCLAQAALCYTKSSLHQVPLGVFTGILQTLSNANILIIFLPLNWQRLI